MTSAWRGSVRAARWRAAGWALAALAGLAAAVLGGDYQLFQLARTTTTAVAVASLVLLTGRGGLVSAGQGALFGVGAYTCAILVGAPGWPWPAAVVAGALLTGLVGLVLGLPAVRLTGVSLALVTLALALLFPLVVSRWPLTGGPVGLDVPPVTPPAWLGMSDAQFLYLATLLALGCTLALAAWWTRGRTGRALAALRTSPAMARAQGVDTAALTVVLVGVSGMMAGLGGALNALVLQTAIPDGFTFTLSLALFTGAVVGGVRSWAGAVIGAAYVVYLPQLASDAVGTTNAGPLSQVCYAASLLITVHVAPGGITGLLHVPGRGAAAPAAGAAAGPGRSPGAVVARSKGVAR